MQLQRAVDFRPERCTFRCVARVLAAPLSIVGRVLKAIGFVQLDPAVSSSHRINSAN